MRPGAQVHFVVVTDDNSALSSNDFVQQIRALSDPGFPDLFTFHTIAAYGSNDFFGCCGWQGCGAGGANAEHYLRLTQQTGGVSFPICTDESEWDGIFDAIAANVVEGTVLPCQYDIPEPGGNLEVDPALINVFHVDGADRVVVPNVDGPGFCDGEGWYYDDPFFPTQVILCNSSCGFSTGRIEIEFGCTTIKG